jgi:predicted ester cyclase
VDNKAILLRFIEATNEQNMDAYKEVVDIANYVEHNPALGPSSFEETVQTYAMMRAALPDLHFTPDLHLMVSEGDQVSARGTVTGTHTGSELFGVPANGKRVDWTGIDVSRIANGKIVERWLCADILRLMQQIGAVPSPGG